MPARRPAALERAPALLAGALILKVTAAVMWGYRAYLPPDFGSDFLRGRETYFWGRYHWAFYAHIAAGPVALLLGLFLVADRARAWSPRWHRRLGRVQVAVVLLAVAPSGLAMAPHAAAGPVAALGLATLAVLTATSAALGARAAMARRFADHRRWMWRCYLLLCSAVVLRMIGGAATVFAVAAPWVDPLANWASWLVPLAAFEWRERARRGMTPRAGRVGASIAEGLRVNEVPAGDRNQGAAGLR